MADPVELQEGSKPATNRAAISNFSFLPIKPISRLILMTSAPFIGHTPPSLARHAHQQHPAFLFLLDPKSGIQ
jgi:hypothetical protein